MANMSPTDITTTVDKHAQTDKPFSAVWSATDSAHFQPTLPLKHIPRAWERKPQSPLVKQRSTRKIWRRHDFPQSQSSTSASGTNSIHNARLAHLKRALTASYSPKKIVKKRCLHTSFGQTAKPNHWDLKASTPMRKKTTPFNVNLPQQQSRKVSSDTDTAVTSATLPLTNVEDDNDQDEWSDVSDEEDSADAASSKHPSPPQSTELQQPVAIATLCEAPNESPLRRSSSAPPEGVMLQETRQKPRISDDTAILHAFLNRAAASKKPTTRTARRESLTNRRDSDVVRQALASPAKTDVLADLDPNSPSPRKAHAPVPEKLARETNDTEGPKLDEQRDANTANDDAETEPEAEVEGDANADTDVEAEGVKPMRRSNRSRNRVANIASLPISPPRHSKRPNKITIRSTGGPVAIQRTDAQELALATRNNTRKNKGGSVMPVLRLCKLATEAASPSAVEEAEPSEKNETKAKKSLRCDSTLVYFQEFSDDSISSSSSQLETSDTQRDNADNDPALALTPMKSKVRRPRTPSKSNHESEQPGQPASVSIEPEVVEKTTQPAAQEETAKAAAPKTRKSRIATPAKALLSNACLLPSDVATTSNTPAVEPASGNKSRRSSTRSLPAPRKLNLESLAHASAPTSAPVHAVAGLPQHLDSGKENHLATPKKSGIPSIKPPATSVPLPKFEPSKAEHDVPGIASPAKKRPKTSFLKAPSVQAPKSQQQSRDEDVVPGLMSPAKKRFMRGKIF